MQSLNGVYQEGIGRVHAVASLWSVVRVNDHGGAVVTITLKLGNKYLWAGNLS